MNQQDNLAFNQNATYGTPNQSFFLGEPRGLIDSVNRIDTTTFDRYKTLKRQDWDENEFPLIEARPDFARYPTEGEMMVNNIGWQWGGDSTAANSLIPMMAPFRPSSDAWLWITKQGDNENLHALSYSEAVKIAVPDGMATIMKIHKDFDTMRRVSFISEVFNHIIRTGAKITLGMVDINSDEASDTLMLALGALLIFERVQFMPSFANTAALQERNKFTPIGETVQKIAIDEWGTHIPQCKYFLECEMRVPARMASLRRVRPKLEELLQEVTLNEVLWNTRQFQILGNEMLGMTENMAADYAYYAASDVQAHMGLKTGLKQVLKNPLPFMDKWLNLNRTQKAVMEGKGGNYLLSSLTRKTTVESRSFDLDDL